MSPNEGGVDPENPRTKVRITNREISVRRSYDPVVLEKVVKSAIVHVNEQSIPRTISAATTKNLIKHFVDYVASGQPWYITKEGNAVFFDLDEEEDLVFRQWVDHLGYKEAEPTPKNTTAERFHELMKAGNDREALRLIESLLEEKEQRMSD